MHLKKKAKILLIYLIPTLILLSMIPFAERSYNSRHRKTGFAGKRIICILQIDDDHKTGKGLQAGFSLEMLRKFSEDGHFTIDIRKPGGKGTNYLDSVKAGSADILIMNRHDSSEVEGIGFTVPIERDIVWAVKKDKKSKRLIEANDWITKYKTSETYNSTVDRFFSDYDVEKRIRTGKHYCFLSPYDKEIREYAALLGWDWRLLAATIYNESQYVIDTRSRRGAFGLMQVMPRTASRYECDNLLDPRENIKTGVKHLEMLQKIFRKFATNKEEREKLTLAAYNAGEGRILDCIHYASSIGKSHDTWKSLTEVIPDMREDAILQVDTVKLGKFSGRETIRYVENVFGTYRQFCKLHPKSIDTDSVRRIDPGNEKRRNKK